MPSANNAVSVAADVSRKYGLFNLGGIVSLAFGATRVTFTETTAARNVSAPCGCYVVQKRDTGKTLGLTLDTMAKVGRYI